MNNLLFWFKFNVDTFDNEAFKLINSMAKRDLVIYVYIRLMILATKTNKNGVIYFREGMPYDEGMLSTILDRSTSAISFSLNSLEKVNIIKRSKNGYIKIVHWDREQFTSVEKNTHEEKLNELKEKNRKRVASFRERKKSKKEGNVTCNVTCNDTCNESGNARDNITKPYIDIYKDLEKDKEKRKGRCSSGLRVNEPETLTNEERKRAERKLL